jgi:Co/Zn/Cd efflux system component/copper chaperone CopZ
MNKSVFSVPKMDCPTEEQLIRMKLQHAEGVRSLEADISRRTVTVYHEGAPEPIGVALATLNLGASQISTETCAYRPEQESDTRQRKLLWTVLLINFAFFAIEIISGWIAHSMGLVADSLDMLADSIVYGLALFAIGGTITVKRNIAKAAGFFQITLAVMGLAEVVRRFVGAEEMPDFRTMIYVSTLSLIANATCLYLLQKSKSREIPIRASMICTSNDVVVNAGVILAGCLVRWLHSDYPDLIVGSVVFVIVMRSAYKILKL